MSWEGIEKRRFVRANFPCTIVIHAPKEHTVSTHTENIGAGGIRVLIEERLDIGVIVGLEIYLYEAREPVICQGKVVWLVQKESLYRKHLIFFDTGFEFHEIKEADRLKIKNIIEAIVLGKNDPGKNK